MRIFSLLVKNEMSSREKWVHRAEASVSGMFEDKNFGYFNSNDESKSNFCFKRINQIREKVMVYVSTTGLMKKEDIYDLVLMRKELNSMGVTLKQSVAASTVRAVEVEKIGFDNWLRYIRNAS